MAGAPPTTDTVGAAMNFTSSSRPSVPVSAAPQHLFEVAVSESMHRNRLKQPNSFENFHQKQFNSSNGTVFRRRRSFASAEAAHRQQHRHMVASQASHTRLSSLADALPHAKPHLRKSVQASRVARRAGGTAHAEAAAATWIEDAQRLDMLHTIASDEWGPRPPQSRGRDGAVHALGETIAEQRRLNSATSGISSLSLGTSQGGAHSARMQPASADWTGTTAKRDGLFDGSLRPLDVPGSAPQAERERVDASERTPSAVRSAGGHSPSESLEFAGETRSGVLVSDWGREATENNKPTSDTITLTGAAGERCVLMNVPPMPKYLRPRGNHCLPGFTRTAGAGGIGRSRTAGHTLLPGRVVDAVLHHEVPLDNGTLDAPTVLQRARDAAPGGTLLASVNRERNPSHKRRQVSHISRCMMQSRNLQRMESDHPRDLTGEFLLAGAWAQQGLHGAPYRPDFDAPSLIGKYSSIALAEQMALRPRGLNTRSGKQRNFEAKMRALSSPGASLMAAASSAGSMHSTGFDLSPRAMAEMSSLGDTQDDSLLGVSSAAHSLANTLRSDKHNTFERTPSATNLLLTASSQAEIDEFEKRTPAALAQTLSKPQLKAALSVPITQDGRTAAAIFHQRGIRLGKRKADILEAATEVGIFDALVKVAASFKGPGMVHPFKNLKHTLERSIRRDLAIAAAEGPAAHETVPVHADLETEDEKHLRRKFENPREQAHIRARQRIASISPEASEILSSLPPPKLDNGKEVRRNQPSSELVEPMERYMLRTSVPKPHSALLVQAARSASPGSSTGGRPQSSAGATAFSPKPKLPSSRTDTDLSMAGDRLRQEKSNSAWGRPGSLSRVAADRRAAPDTGDAAFRVTDQQLVSPKQRLLQHKHSHASPIAPAVSAQLNVDDDLPGKAMGAKTLTPRSQTKAYQLFERKQQRA